MTMNKLMKYSGDINRALRTVISRMNSEGSEYVTWSNSQTGARFIAKRSTVEKMYKNKFENANEIISDNEIVKLSSNGLTVNEVKESGKSRISEGFSGKEVTEIDPSKINILEQVLYNKDFDCEVLFKS